MRCDDICVFFWMDILGKFTSNFDNSKACDCFPVWLKWASSFRKNGTVRDMHKSIKIYSPYVWACFKWRCLPFRFPPVIYHFVLEVCVCVCVWRGGGGGCSLTGEVAWTRSLIVMSILAPGYMNGETSKPRLLSLCTKPLISDVPMMAILGFLSCTRARVVALVRFGRSCCRGVGRRKCRHWWSAVIISDIGWGGAARKGEDVTSFVAEFDELAVELIISFTREGEILVLCRQFDTVIKPLSSLFTPTAANNDFATWVTDSLRALGPSFTGDTLLLSLWWIISTLFFYLHGTVHHTRYWSTRRDLDLIDSQLEVSPLPNMLAHPSLRHDWPKLQIVWKLSQKPRHWSTCPSCPFLKATRKRWIYNITIS